MASASIVLGELDHLSLWCLGEWCHLSPSPFRKRPVITWLPIEHIGGNSVAWCLSILVIFYAIYPLLARLKTVQLFLLFLLIHIGLRMFEGMLPIADIHWYWCRLPISRILEFLIGILCYRSYQHIITPYGNSVLRRIFQYTHTHAPSGLSRRFLSLYVPGGLSLWILTIHPMVLWLTSTFPAI